MLGRGIPCVVFLAVALPSLSGLGPWAALSKPAPGPAGDPGTGWTPDSLVSLFESTQIQRNVSVAADRNGTVHAAYESFSPVYQRFGICNSQSRDGGASWTGHNCYGTTRGDLRHPSVAVNGMGGEALIAFEGGEGGLWLMREFPGMGGCCTVLTTHPGDHHPSIAFGQGADASAFLAFERDDGAGGTDLMFTAARDRGAWETWESPLRLVGALDSAANRRPRVGTADPSIVYVAYERGPPGGERDVYLMRSDFAGFPGTWTSSPGAAVASTTEDEFAPDVAAFRGIPAVVVPFVRSSPVDQVHLAVSGSRGEAGTWSVAAVTMDPWDHRNPRIVAVPEVGAIRLGWWSPSGVFVSTSLDALPTAWTPPVRVNDAAAMLDRAYDLLGIAAFPAGGRWHTGVAWTDYRNGPPNYDIYYTRGEIRTSQITIDTVPTGLTVEVDGAPRIVPHSFACLPEMPNTANATSPQFYGGTWYVFRAWSDGAPRERTIPCDADGTYTATFEPEGGVPDLTVAPSDIQISPNPPLANGTSTVVNVTVRNAGNGGAGPTVVRFFDGIPPAAQIGMDQPLGPLAANGTATVFVPWTVSPPGAHDVCVVVDPDDRVAERDEGNNVACLVVTVLPPETRPDYAPAAPQPSGTVRIGLSLPLSFSLEVVNLGNGTATAAAILALFNASSPAAPFASFLVPPLAPGRASSRFAALWTSPSVPGAVTVLADVDSGDDVLEWDETNNRIAWTVEVVEGPVTQLVVGQPNATVGVTYVSSSTPLSLSAQDPGGTGIRRTRYRVDGGTWTDYATGPFSLLTEGERLLEWSSEDNAGNVEPVRSAILRVDDTPPTVDLAVGDPKHVGADTYATSATPLALTSTDGGTTPAGVASIEYRIDGGEWIPFSAPFTLVGEGVHTVESRATDLLGNAAPPRTFPLIVDDTPPDVSASVGDPKHAGADLFVTSATPIALSASDPGSLAVGLASIEYRIDDGVWSAYAAPITLAGDGMRAVACRATDLLGNGAAVLTLSVNVDDTPPVTTPSRWDGAYPVGTTLEFHATDAGSGVARTEVRVDGGAWAVYAVPLALPEGDHSIGFRSADHLGNTESERVVSVTLGSGPPPPPVPEMNWKPPVAAVFAAVLAAAGAGSARRAPWKSGRRRTVRAFAFAAFPFAAAEAATGVLSLLTGVLAIPPLVGPGTVVDIGILVAGLAVCGVRLSRRELSE